MKIEFDEYDTLAIASTAVFGLSSLSVEVYGTYYAMLNSLLLFFCFLVIRTAIKPKKHS